MYKRFFISRGDFRIPEVTFCEYVWDNIEEHAHLPGLVCGITGEVMLHGEVIVFFVKIQRVECLASDPRAVTGGC